MTFHVGQKVVCVWRKDSGLLVHRTYVGRIYTIRGFDDISAPFCDGIPGLYFEELANKKIITTVGLFEPSYSASRFRPLVERKTDISFAHEILRRSSKQVDA